MFTDRQKLRLSYGAGGVCDNTLYTLTGTYLLIYLTTVAGVSPAVAGTISAIGSIWEAVIGPVIGFWSDRTISRFGKRKPFMLAAAVPIMIVTGMLFSSFDMGQTTKAIYYCIMIILFWTFFSMEFIPYISWGADLTDEYHERTVLRSYAYVFNQVGMLIGMVMPAIIVDISLSRGISDTVSWSIAGIFCGICAGGSLLISAGTIKKDDRNPHSAAFIEEKKQIKVGKSPKRDALAIFREFSSILRLKSIRYLIGASMVYLIANTIFSSDRVFFMTYNLEMSNRAVSGIMFLITISGIIFVPFIERFCRKIEKKNVFMIGIGGAGVILILLRFINIGEYSGLIAACLVYSVANTCYWQLMPSMIYDVSEIEEHMSGKSHAGSVVSLQALSESVCIAIGLQILGIILEKSGFDETAEVAATQTATALNWVSNSFTLIPGIFMLLVFFIMTGYPITKKEIESIIAQKNK